MCVKLQTPRYLLSLSKLGGEIFTEDGGYDCPNFIYIYFYLIILLYLLIDDTDYESQHLFFFRRENGKFKTFFFQQNDPRPLQSSNGHYYFCLGGDHVIIMHLHLHTPTHTTAPHTTHKPAQPAASPAHHSKERKSFRKK